MTEADMMKVLMTNYDRTVEAWRKSKREVKELSLLGTQEVIILKLMLHSTAHAGAREFTRSLIHFLCDQRITTAEQIQKALGCSNKPMLKRLKLFKGCMLIRREAGKYYLVTPRMIELRDKYLERICS